MKKLLKNKRGIAMESAVLFMLVMFMFGFLLTGVAMTAHLRVKVNNTIIKREMEIEQIGEDFVTMLPTAFTQDYVTATYGAKYTADVSSNGNNKTLTLKRNTSTVLKITVEGGTITSWKYPD